MYLKRKAKLKTKQNVKVEVNIKNNQEAENENEIESGNWFGLNSECKCRSWGRSGSVDGEGIKYWSENKSESGKGTGRS